MVLESLAVGGAALVSGVAGFFIAKKMEAANYEIHVAQARAKATAAVVQQKPKARASSAVII